MDIDLITRIDKWHPNYGPYDITDFVPSPPDVLARIAYLTEHGDHSNELPCLLRLLVKMARLICRDTAITFALVSDRSDMPDDVRVLVDYCLPPAETPDEAFAVWLQIAQRGAEIELQSIQASDLAPDVKDALTDLVQRRLTALQQQAGNVEELAMQVVAVWWVHEQFLRTAGIAMDAVGLTTADQYAKEKAWRLQPLDADYILALADVRGVPMEDFKTRFKLSLAKHERIRCNPSGTGKNPKYEHEVAESQLDLPENIPSPLDVAPSSEPDPAEVVADRDAVERILARFGKRTADLIRLMMDGMSIAEAARSLGMKEATARKLVERARKQFSRSL